MKKKIILGILASVSSVAPIAGVISCGDKAEEKDKNKTEVHSKGNEQTTGTQHVTTTTITTTQTTGTITGQQQAGSGTSQLPVHQPPSTTQPAQQPQHQPAPQNPAPVQTQPQQSNTGSAPLTGTTIVPPPLSSDIPQPTSYEVVAPTTLNGNDGKILIKGIDMNTYTVPQITKDGRTLTPPTLVATASSSTNEGEIDGLSPGKYSIALVVKDRTKTFAGTFGDKEIHYSFTIDYAPAGMIVYPTVQIKAMQLGTFGFSKRDGSSFGYQSAYYMTMPVGSTITAHDFESAFNIANADGTVPYAAFTWVNGQTFDPNVVGSYRITFVAKVDNTNLNYPPYKMLIDIDVHN